MKQNRIIDFVKLIALGDDSPNSCIGPGSLISEADAVLDAWEAYQVTLEAKEKQAACNSGSHSFQYGVCTFCEVTKLQWLEAEVAKEKAYRDLAFKPTPITTIGGDLLPQLGTPTPTWPIKYPGTFIGSIGLGSIRY